MTYDPTTAESDIQQYAPLIDPRKLLLGADVGGDIPVPSPQTLQSLASWVRANGYGGMMLWICNPDVATPQQIQAIEQGLGI